MKITDTELEGVKIIEPTKYSDSRGFFLESYNQKKYLDAGINLKFVQDNHSSSKKGVLRGLHFQKSRPQESL